MELGDREAALSISRKSLGIARKLVKMDPRNAMSRRNLAHFQGMVGIAAAHTGRMKEGLSHLQTALKMWRDLEASGVLEPLDASRPSELESLLHRLSGRDSHARQRGLAFPHPRLGWRAPASGL